MHNRKVPRCTSNHTFKTHVDKVVYLDKYNKQHVSVSGCFRIPLCVPACVQDRGGGEGVSLLRWLVQAELTCGVLTVVLQASSLLSVCLPNCSLTAAPRHRLFLPPLSLSSTTSLP